mmetsp:Transcript_13918/g.24392  ORF Transcript_13918/g.24392 Transcript_13918/m.24392 type:complete len:347 (-) Transcript_13918:595-1635(-)
MARSNAKKQDAAEDRQASVGALEAPSSEDTVQHEFGAEYSENTLNILRGFEKPPFLVESSSLDPADDLATYMDLGLAMPPASYEVLQAWGEDEIERLARLREPTNSAQADLVRYRQQLAEGASHQDMTWLKLRAYHRAMAQLRADQAHAKAELDMDRLQAYEVPTDRVPADLLNLTPKQLAERRRLAELASAKAKQQQQQSHAQRLLSLPEPSEESEWEIPPSVLLAGASVTSLSSLPVSAVQGVLHALRRHRGGLHVLQQELVPQQEDLPQEPGSEVQPRVFQTVYAPAYLEQQRLDKFMRRQRQQRTAAFWVGLLTVSGLSLLRFLRRKMRKPSMKRAKSGTAA